MSPSARAGRRADPAPLDLAGKRVVVVGLAASGLAATRVLADLGARVRVTERRDPAEVAQDAREALTTGAEVLAGGHAPEHLEGAELVVTSPGVAEGADVLRWARERGLPIWSEIELGARMARAPYVAVTGTNGKTTTTEMVAASLRRAELDAVACGNVGYPFSLAAREPHDALAVEASSFQLRFHKHLHPRVSVLLNLAPDHLDWHGSFQAYRAAKARIFERQDAADVHVGNRDDPEAAALSRGAPCPVVWFTLAEPEEGETGYVRGELVARLDAEHRLGRPMATAPSYRANAAAAGAAALAFGLDPAPVGDALSEFAPLSHRGVVVAEIDGVRFVDDSKATNPHAALSSIAGWERIVLIAGGLSKGVDLSPMARAAPRLTAVVVLGAAADEVEAAFAAKVPVARAASIEEAVAEAHRLVEPGGTVLLAPACASQDMFRDYRERGRRFATAARALEGRG